MAYPIELRIIIIDFVSQGNSIQKAHDVFKVGTTTIKRWIKEQNETGKQEIKPRVGTPRKLDPVKLKAYISENPDRFLHEIADVFQCSAVAVFKAFKRYGITRKKN